MVVSDGANDKFREVFESYNEPDINVGVVVVCGGFLGGFLVVCGGISNGFVVICDGILDEFLNGFVVEFWVDLGWFTVLLVSVGV